MGNKTNDQYWAVTERLRFIEACAWWKGIVQRQDLGGLFGISMPQASSDLQRYLELNPSAFVYNLRKKRYEATAEMKCVMTQPRLDEAVGRFLSDEACGVWNGRADESDGRGRVSVVRMPVREASAAVERRVFLAVLNGLRIKVRYASVNSGKEEWRWLSSPISWSNIRVQGEPDLFTGLSTREEWRAGRRLVGHGCPCGMWSS